MNPGTMKPNWEDAPEWANYLAMDADANWWWFENKPEKSLWNSLWNSYDRGQVSYAGSTKVNWAESLESR